MTRILKIGTRGSALAQWQANHIARLLQQAHPSIKTELVIITTQGDKVLDVPLAQLGGKGAFTGELERALYKKDIDIAVHSLKDLPTTHPDGLVIGAIPQRGVVYDVIISKHGTTLDGLAQGANVGTGSIRRKAQLLHYRSDLRIVQLRGNVDTRIAKAMATDGDYDAIVLAGVGIERLARESVISEILPFGTMLPAPAQGALAVQCHADSPWLSLIATLDHAETHTAVSLERAFLASLGSGCSLPVGAYAYREQNKWHFWTRVLSHDGTQKLYDHQILDKNLSESETLVIGKTIAEYFLNHGASTWLTP